MGPVAYRFEISESEVMTVRLASFESTREGDDPVELILDRRALGNATLREQSHNYWRVRASTPSGPSQWVYGSFVVAAHPMRTAPFRLSAPPDGGAVDMNRPTLTVTGARNEKNRLVRFTCEVFAADDEAFTAPVARATDQVPDNTGDIAWTVSPALVNGQQYY